MAQSEKKPVKMTTEEAIRKLFPKRVIRKAKQVAAAAGTKRSIQKDASGL